MLATIGETHEATKKKGLGKIVAIWALCRYIPIKKKRKNLWKQKISPIFAVSKMIHWLV